MHTHACTHTHTHTHTRARTHTHARKKVQQPLTICELSLAVVYEAGDVLYALNVALVDCPTRVLTHKVERT
jgi:hypothetical protein